MWGGRSSSFPGGDCPFAACSCVDFGTQGRFGRNSPLIPGPRTLRRPKVKPRKTTNHKKDDKEGIMNAANKATQLPPLPPFTRETAIEKVRLAENGWNSRNPEKVALAYTVDSWWRNRAEFVQGRPAIIEFLTRKWKKELDYRLIKELWAFGGNRIAVRFAYEWHDDSANWFRAYGNENWEFDNDGLMTLRLASINDLPIKETERKYH